MKTIGSTITTTLFLNSAYQPMGFFTPKIAFKHLCKGSARALDCFGNLHDFESWISNSASYWENQPFINTRTQSYAVPTIMVLSNHFGFRRKRDRKKLSLKQLYKLYEGVCQFCLEPISFRDATQDHYYPKSKGGANNDFNIILACRKCNRAKGDTFPYLNANGVEPKVINFLDFHHNTAMDPRQKDIARPEWEQFLFKS